MIKFPLRKSYLERAHKHSSHHKAEVEKSVLCGCFYCEKTFHPSEIKEWVGQEGDEALCPRCGIDAVIGSASGLPVSDPYFLKSMNLCYFGWAVEMVKGEFEGAVSKFDPAQNKWISASRPSGWETEDFVLVILTNSWRFTLDPNDRLG